MKIGRGDRILVGVGCLLLLAGIGPLLFAVWEGSQSQPLAVPFSLKRGEYTSPYFRTYLSGAYQIDIDSLPFQRTPLDMDWKIVDDRGSVILQGTYADQDRGGNDVILTREYRPRFGQRQRIITDVHRDVVAARSTARLEIGQPEISLDLSYGVFLILGWAGIVGGAGGILLVVLLVRRAMSRNSNLSA